MSTQDTAAPKRRSAAANRRRKRQGEARAAQANVTRHVSVDELESAPSSVVTDASVRLKPVAEPQKESRSERKAAAREETTTVEADALPREKHLRRREERREAKSRKPEKSGRRRFINTERFGPFHRFYQDASSEIRKVEWPDREATRNLTVVVIALSVILGIMLGGIDYVLFQLFEALS